MNIIKKIKSNQTLKKIALWMLQSPMRPRPRLWISLFVNPFFHKRGRNSMVSRTTRMDVFPFNDFEIGKWSTIENFSCINNAMGSVKIGNHSRVGLSNTVIGPVTIGDNVNIAQNVVISGLNHGYEDVNLAPRSQKCTKSPINISNDCWIGANVVITAGVTIGKHCVVAAGSIVTKNVPPFSVVAGNPAKVIKQYDMNTKLWLKVKSEQLDKKNYGTAA